MEVWKNIKGFEERYQVSNLGKFKSLDRETVGVNGITYKYKGRIMKTRINKGGYESVAFHRNGKNINLIAHRLIAIAFIPNPENKPHINHINGIKTDNRLENLEWCTQKENIQHAHKTGLTNPAVGENHGRHKLTRKNVVEIRNKFSTGMYSKRKLGEMYGVNAKTISSVVLYKTWRNI